MTRCLCYHNTVLSPSACPRVSYVMTSTWPGLRNNNIKCLLSLSRKTNLIIRSANKSLASNMVLIFRLSFSKVNTRVVSQLGNAEHSRVFISRSVLRKFHHPQCLCPKPGLCRKFPHHDGVSGHLLATAKSSHHPGPRVTNITE